MKSDIQENQGLETKQTLPISPLSVITPQMLQMGKERLTSLAPPLANESKRNSITGGRLIIRHTSEELKEAKNRLKRTPLKHTSQVQHSNVGSIFSFLSEALTSRRNILIGGNYRHSDNNWDEDWDTFDEEKGQNPRKRILLVAFDWIIQLLSLGQLNDDTQTPPSFKANKFRATFRQSIKTGSLDLSKYFSGYISSHAIFEKLAEIINYCVQAIKHISLPDNTLDFSLLLFLSKLNLSEISAIESIHCVTQRSALFVVKDAQIFYSNLLTNRTLKNLQWNVVPSLNQEKEEKEMITNIENHVDYNNSCAVAIAAYVTLMFYFPTDIVQSMIIEYLIGDKNYAPRLSKPVIFSNNCMTFLNVNTKLSSPNSQSVETCPQFVG